jgi:two-component system chemotaxis response regulator CheB
MPTRILIADDNEVVRGRLSDFLASHDGWEVCAAVGNGRDAVEKAIELKPSLIILDLAMPVMDGLSTAREIGRLLPSVPILLFTLHKFAAIDLEAKKAGVRHVVEKPDTDALLRAAEELLKSGSLEPVREKTELLASVSGPLDAPTAALTVQPQASESQASDDGDSETSTKAN